MNRTEILNAVSEILHQRGFEGADSEDLLLEADLGFDSLDMVELEIDCERKFNISNCESGDWKTLRDVVDCVEKLIGIKEANNPPLV